MKTHYFICTFQNQNCLTIFRQNIKLLPKGTKFEASLPKEYQATLNEYTKIQNHIRNMKDKNGVPTMQAKLEYAQGHISLQLRNRINADNHGPWQTHKSILPRASTPVHSKIPQNIIFKTTLRAYNWPDPISPAIQRELIDSLNKLAYVEHSAFYK